MRICILAKDIPPRVTDGIARNRWTYARQFQKQGHEVHIITSGVRSLEEYRDGIYIHEVAIDTGSEAEDAINRLVKSEEDRYSVAYSHAVYKRIKKLTQHTPIDIIDQSLWGLEGLITKIKLPGIPMLSRIDTTSRLIYEINYPGKTNDFTVRNQLEQFMLQHTDALIFNSWSILHETQRLYNVNFSTKPYSVIYHGMDIHAEQTVPSKEEPNRNFRVFIPGRLEKRKGTYILLSTVLPELLAQKNNIEIHFAGRDNSEWDGFYNEHGATYTEYIKKHFARDIDKRIFLHGHVSDGELSEHYEMADCVLAPSLYESFGLVYLEAAGFRKPLIALDAGAVSELFKHGKEALLASPKEPKQLVDYIYQLRDNKSLRERLAANAYLKLKTKFNAVRMSNECLSFIEDLLMDKNTGTVYQLINSLTLGDGVSNFVRDYDYIFKESGQLAQIIGNHASESLRHLTEQIHDANFKENDTLLYHYCGHCEWAEYINAINGPKKVLFFHNITPPHFFKENTSEFKSAYHGLQQVEKLNNFDLYVALSDYSLKILQQMIPQKLDKMIMPQLLDKKLITDKPYSRDLAANLRKQHPFHIIFVGRVVSHKKQIDIIRFAHYFTTHFKGDLHISIIGGGSAAYIQELNDLIRKYSLKDVITLTGKISDEDLYAYYRSADVYLSMSEHEGFGTPLAEAMVFGVPVVAYGVTAIPETIGDNGCVFFEKDHHLVSEIVNRLRADKDFVKDVVLRQNDQLEKYSVRSIERQLHLMQEKSTELYSIRRNKLANSNRLYKEEFLNYKDSRFERKGEWSTADGRTLIHYGHDGNSSLNLHVPFYEADIFIVNNSHSGKATIYVNNEEVMCVDLYNDQWYVKKYTLTNKSGVIKHIKIVPMAARNEKSTGREVLIYGVLLKHSYWPLIKNVSDNFSMTINMDGAENDAPAVQKNKQRSFSEDIHAIGTGETD